MEEKRIFQVSETQAKIIEKQKKFLQAIEEEDRSAFYCLSRELETFLNSPFFEKTSERVWKHNMFSFACRHGALEFAESLLKKGADPIGKSSDLPFCTSLVSSVFYGHFHVADWLQKTLGVDCSIDNSFSARIAASHGQLEALVYSFSHGADPRDSRESGNALVLAAGESPEIVRCLLERFPEIEQKEEALLRAVRQKNLEAAKILLRYKAETAALPEEELQWLHANFQKLARKKTKL